jgi:hypothetical protein
VIARVFAIDAREPVLVVKDPKLGERSGLVGFLGYPGTFTKLENYAARSVTDPPSKGGVKPPHSITLPTSPKNRPRLAD